MIPQIKKILYVTDLSQKSAYVFRYAANSAKKHDAKIIILHVLGQLSASAEAIVRSYIAVTQERKIQEKNNPCHGSYPKKTHDLNNGDHDENFGRL